MHHKHISGMNFTRPNELAQAAHYASFYNNLLSNFITIIHHSFIHSLDKFLLESLWVCLSYWTIPSDKATGFACKLRQGFLIPNRFISLCIKE